MEMKTEDRYTWKRVAYQEPHVPVHSQATHSVGEAYGWGVPEGTLEQNPWDGTRFSAFKALIQKGLVLISIEIAYQQLKGTGKGKPAKNPNFKYWETYLALWKKWARWNRYLMEELLDQLRFCKTNILTDKFAKTENNQARALAHLLSNPDEYWTYNAYAGVGARVTPQAHLSWMTKFAGVMESKGWILRSGAAKGADSAFMEGCAWYNQDIFTAEHGVVAGHNAIGVLALAEKMHPAWDRLKPYVKKLMVRNIMILLGPDLDHPVKFLICWCNGTHDQPTGGTAMAIRTARFLGIPVFFSDDPEVFTKMKEHHEAGMPNGADGYGMSRNCDHCRSYLSHEQKHYCSPKCKEAEATASAQEAEGERLAEEGYERYLENQGWEQVEQDRDFDPECY